MKMREERYGTRQLKQLILEYENDRYPIALAGPILQDVENNISACP